MTSDAIHGPSMESTRNAQRAHIERTPSRSTISMKIKMTPPSMTTPKKKHQTMMRYTPHSIQRAKKTPGSSIRSVSPSVRSDGDRYIPSRRGMHIGLIQRSLFQSSTVSEEEEEEPSTSSATYSQQDQLVKQQYKRQLLSSLCDVPPEMLNHDSEPKRLFSFGANSSTNNENVVSSSSTITHATMNALTLNPFGASVLEAGETGPGNLALPTTHQAPPRVFPKNPSKILDAPGLQNDFYSQLTSWSQDNMLAVALGASLYTYDPVTTQVTNLGPIGGSEHHRITCVSWCRTRSGTHILAVGFANGHVIVLDMLKVVSLQRVHHHKSSVFSIEWNGSIMTTASRDTTIRHYDLRSDARDANDCWRGGHEQSVVNMKWNHDSTVLASGGNDDIVCLWDIKKISSNYSQAVTPRFTLAEHKGAVKALDWCPFKHNMLATGGGNSDQTVKLWNTDTGVLLKSHPTRAQVSGLVWNPHGRKELVAAYGFGSNKQDQIALWKYSSQAHGLTKLHACGSQEGRVLNMEISPDGATLLTAGDDESLSFWNNLFEVPPPSRKSVLDECSFGGHVIR
jgi:WD40 repeat protein